MRTYLIHTDAANNEKVRAYVGDQKVRHGEPDAVIEACSVDSAGNIGDADPQLFEAVISAGLPKCQELVSAYKDLGVRATVIGATDPDHLKKVKAQQAEAEKAEKAAKKGKG